MNISLEEKAKLFAIKAHEGQERKDKKPFILHPIEVAKILKDHGFSEAVCAAGFLHDVVEDTDYSIEDILTEFGEEVTKIVAANTENKELSWEERKEHTVDSIPSLTYEEKGLIAADKFSNMLSVKENFDNGATHDTYWKMFKRDFDQQKWYYTTVANTLLSTLEENQDDTLFVKLKELTDSIFTK